MAQPLPAQLFYCYAPEDESLRKELDKHLTLLERQNFLASWSGHTVGAGEDWRAEIERRMGNAEFILLLISADFIASDHLYGVELPRALERSGEGAYVFGVLLRPTDWNHDKLKNLKMLPRAAPGDRRAVPQTLQGLGGTPDDLVVPVTEWTSYDAAFGSVAEVLREKLKLTGRSSLNNRITVNPSEAHPRSAPRG